MYHSYKNRKQHPHHNDYHENNRHNILLAVFALLLAGCITIITDV